MILLALLLLAVPLSAHNGAVAQIGGAFYRVDGIPEHWFEKLAMRGKIEGLATRLIEGAKQTFIPSENAPSRHGDEVAA